MITPPVEYTMNVMHQKPDIENNIVVMKHKLKVYGERLVKIEEKVFDKYSYVSDFCKCVEVICLWTLVILLSVKVFN
jgi:hypothetical protein